MCGLTQCSSGRCLKKDVVKLEEIIKETGVIFCTTAAISVSQEELRYSPWVQLHSWLRPSQAPKSVVLLKRMCSSRCQDCILALPVLLLFVAILVFFVYYKNFRLLVSSIEHSEITARNVGVEFLYSYSASERFDLKTSHEEKKLSSSGNYYM